MEPGLLNMDERDIDRLHKNVKAFNKKYLKLKPCPRCLKRKVGYDGHVFSPFPGESGNIYVCMNKKCGYNWKEHITPV